MAFNSNTKNPQKDDTSWQNVAKWYGDVPKKDNSYHNTLVFPYLSYNLKHLLKPGSFIVDIACGEGTITKKLGDLGYKMFGTDMSQDLINNARHNYPEINFVKEDARNLSSGFIKMAENCDAVLCILALQNIDDLDGVIKGVAKILKKGGLFIALINHPYFRIPKSTSWGFEGLDRQYRIVDSYMSDQKIPITAHPGEASKLSTKDKSEVTYSFHRPLETYIKTFNANGLALVDMDELISNKESEPGRRAEAENYARQEIPLFMGLIAKKN